MVKFGHLGSIVPDAVFDDIGQFLSKDEIREFSLLSPRANRLVKTFKLLDLSEIKVYKQSDAYNLTHNGKEPTVNKWKQEYIWMFLRRCRSIEKITLENVTIDGKILNLLMKIDIKDLLLENTPINISLPSFLKFLRQFPNNRMVVKVPSEYVSNQTLKLMNDIDISCLATSNPNVDVNDEFLLERNSHFELNGFKTGFTIQGISNFYQKTKDIEGRSSFGILGSEHLQEAIQFYDREITEDCILCLCSSNGQKTVDFCLMFEIYGSFKAFAYSINLNTDDNNSSGMVPVPQHLFGQVSQQVFQKFDQILNDPYNQFQPDAFRVRTLTFNFCSWNAGLIEIEYTAENAWEYAKLERTDVKKDDLAMIISGILKNCVFINTLNIRNIVLDETLYKLLKPFAGNIVVQNPLTIDILLKAELFEELLSAENGLFGMIDIVTSKYISEEVPPNEALVSYLETEYNIDVSHLSTEVTSTGCDTWLTDDFLYVIGLNADRISENFCFKSYQTTYSVEGMKDFIEVVFSRWSNIYFNWHLGTIDSKEIYMDDLIKQFEMDKEAYQVTRTAGFRNGQLYTTVAIMKSSSPWFFSIAFDVLQEQSEESP